jgi:hypothetical protein
LFHDADVFNNEIKEFGTNALSTVEKWRKLLMLFYLCFMRIQRLALLMIVFLLTFQGYSQKLKKKYYGSYSGEIPAFVMDVGGDVAQVEQALITIKLLENNQVEQAIGPQVLTGRWELISMNKSEAEIRLFLNGQQFTETVFLQLKKQELNRKGFYPQPDTVLKKDKS